MHKDHQNRFWSKVNMAGPGQCWDWTAARLVNGGYGAFRHMGRTLRAHRVAWELHNGRKLGQGEVILHMCNNTACCNPEHLVAGTQADNISHAGACGSMARPGRRLPQSVVSAILESNGSFREIGRKFGVYHKTVADIKRRGALAQ